MLQESVVHRPHPALRPFVGSITGYRQEGVPPGVHRGVPAPGLTMIVTIDEPVMVAAQADLLHAPDAYDALVGGLHTTPALVVHNGRQCGIQLSLTPLGARALLGAPAGRLGLHDLADVLGRPGTELIERVRASPGWAGRLAAVEDVLLRLAREQVALEPEVGEAWRLTTQSFGRLRVAEIADRVGWSSRHLGERFRAETGLTPKEAGRVARFDRARGLLVRRVGAGRSADLAALAAVCGYADQAHLTREWRALSGLPPSRYLAAELGFVQDNPVPDAAGSPA